MKNKTASIRSKQARSAFTLTELLVLLAVICVLGAIVMPPIYRTRIDMNEAAAKELLQMLHTSQTSWKQHTGSWARLHSVAYAPGPPSDLEPFMPFVHASEDGVAHVGGYRFTQTLDSRGIPNGCVAAPITPNFSGRLSYTLDYASGEIVELDPGSTANSSAAF